MSALIVFIQKAIAQGIGMLFGATGEIITEKSGNLNLGVPGLRAFGKRCMVSRWLLPFVSV